MDIQTIIDGIVDAGKQEIASINKKANDQITAIREKAVAEANQQKERILKDSRIRSKRTQAIIEQRTAMQSLQMHANARQKLILMVLEKTKSDLKTFRDKPIYCSTLQKLINDAIHAVLPSLIGNQKIVLHVNQEDEQVIQSVDIPCKEKVQIQYDLQCSGGCEVESEDGLVRVLNTFESRFDRALPKIQQDLSVFFEEQITSS